jgi:hypothetical protein
MLFVKSSFKKPLSFFILFWYPNREWPMSTSLMLPPPLSTCVPTSTYLLLIHFIHTDSTITTLHPSTIGLQILNACYAILTLHVCLFSPTRYVFALFTSLELQVCPLVWYFPLTCLCKRWKIRNTCNLHFVKVFLFFFLFHFLVCFIFLYVLVFIFILLFLVNFLVLVALQGLFSFGHGFRFP